MYIKSGRIQVDNHKNWTPEQEFDFFKKYRAVKNPEKKRALRNMATEQYIPLVNHIISIQAGKRLGDRYDHDDAYQEALRGLMASIERYNPNNPKKCRFLTYAAQFILGYLKHYNRDQSLLLTGMRDAYDKLLPNAITNTQASEELKQMLMVTSLDEPKYKTDEDNDFTSKIDSITDHNQDHEEEVISQMEREYILSQLDDFERQIVACLHEKGMTIKEIQVKFQLNGDEIDKILYDITLKATKLRGQM